MAPFLIVFSMLRLKEGDFTRGIEVRVGEREFRVERKSSESERVSLGVFGGGWPRVRN